MTGSLRPRRMRVVVALKSPAVSAGPARAAVAEALALSLGFAAQYLFIRELVGLNVVTAIAAALACAWSMRPSGVRISLEQRWLSAGAIVFAALCALRVDAPVVAFDIAASIGLAVVTIVSLRGVAIRSLALPELVAASTETALRIATGGASVIASGAPALTASIASRSARSSAYVGGVLLAVPFVVIFGALFSSADAVFRHIVETAIDLDALRQLIVESPTRGAVLLLVMWAAAGTFAALGADRAISVRRITPVAATETATTFLAIIDLLFAVFVFLQVTYLFGGRDTIDAAGITYSAYGRSGFFELVAVAALVAVLLFAIDLVVRRRSRMYVLAALLLIALCAVVLASAWLRMDLYQRAYGWSELRFYAFAGIAFIGIALAILGTAIVRGVMAVTLQRLAFAGLAVAAVVNLIGPSDFVARRNLERVIDPSSLPDDASRGLDVAYLMSLGEGAVPAVAELAPSLPSTERSMVFEALRLRGLRSADAHGWQSLNLDRERARSVVVRASSSGGAFIR